MHFQQFWGYEIGSHSSCHLQVNLQIFLSSVTQTGRSLGQLVRNLTYAKLGEH